MIKLDRIQILETDSNLKGDLFGRLMGDLFQSMGYEKPTLNINRTGREIDLQSMHRVEEKIAVAECKAHAEPIGGSDINKFVGVLDAEKRRFKNTKEYKKHQVTGFFVSLSGFKPTANEQEKELGKRIIQFGPVEIVRELTEGNIIVSLAEAAAAITQLPAKLKIWKSADLLAYQKGWIWALYYSDNGQTPSAFTLIHADGNPLIPLLADEIIQKDKTLGNHFVGLSYVSQQNTKTLNTEDVKEKYFKYIERECGEIQFEGLPTDKETGSVRVNLESIFIPLHFYPGDGETEKDEENDEDIDLRKGIEQILKPQSRLAILAKPGGGKSTLLKRIAIAYAFPQRRTQVSDNLPDVEWFPVFLRCRELGSLAHSSISEIINSIPSRAEIRECSREFEIVVSENLQNGKALLLIDGLDEISDDRQRIGFINHLTTFLATYPSVSVIITSRVAGFRIVAGTLSNYCNKYTVAGLDSNEIRQLCNKWHESILDNSERTMREARELSEQIISDGRIKVLAENPLLLTTLLFVRRWAGYLPTKKSILYEEMIKLLLVTWNVEGHEQLDKDETESQLAYVAYWMTTNNTQRITEDQLKRCLTEARKKLTWILSYVKISESAFIKSVESRSSLLIMSGFEKLESGQLSPIYEFLHLSFQEYLTAKAVVKEYTLSNSTSLKIVKTNVKKQNWREVIPLIATLLEKDSKNVIQYLIAETKKVAPKNKEEGKPKRLDSSEVSIPWLLGSCLANGVQIDPVLLKHAMGWYAKSEHFIDSHILPILNGKYGEVCKDEVKRLFLISRDYFLSNLGSALATIYLKSNNDEFSIRPSVDILTKISNDLSADTKIEQCMALLGFMEVSYSLAVGRSNSNSEFDIIVNEICKKIIILLKNKDTQLQFCICWALGWAPDAFDIAEETLLQLSTLITPIWLKATQYNHRRVASWSLSRMLRADFPQQAFKKTPTFHEALSKSFSNPLNDYDKYTSVYLGAITGFDFPKKEIEVLLNQERAMRFGMNTVNSFAKKYEISLRKK